MSRLAGAIGALFLPAALSAQAAPLATADSTLLHRVLAAEDRGDTTDAALAEAMRHGDPRVRVVATRALGRMRDPKFPLRDSLPAAAPAPAWPEPAWRLRLRALTRDTDCLTLRRALADSTWPVRLRAADLAGQRCAGDSVAIRMLREWLYRAPVDAPVRAPGGVTWHAAAHALVALARLDPARMRDALPGLAVKPRWQLRRAVARAALVLADTARLRALAADRDPNVQEEAIAALATLTGHASDELYLRAIEGDRVQPVRVAAEALTGSPRADAAPRAMAAFRRWVKRGNASERDVRVALLAAAGRPATDDEPPAARSPLPREAVALALGADVRLRVTMDRASGGGGSFVVRLRGDVAPIMAARILALVRRRYYDGLTWHRVEHDFVIQGGSPGANEYVGWKEYLRDELGTLAHPRGTVGMSTRGHDTGDAQWFVNLRDNARLRADYTVFGEVVEGIEVVDGVMEGDVIASIRAER